MMFLLASIISLMLFWGSLHGDESFAEIGKKVLISFAIGIVAQVLL